LDATLEHANSPVISPALLDTLSVGVKLAVSRVRLPGCPSLTLGSEHL